MSRKSISIVVPQKSAESNVTPIPASVPSKAESKADRWVRQEEKSVAPVAVPGCLTITIPPEPDWFDMARIGLFLPQIALWYWTVNASRRNWRLFLR